MDLIINNYSKWYFFYFIFIFEKLNLSLLLERLSRQLSLTKVPKLRLFSLKEVAQHCTADSCWMVIKDKVYDLTDFIHDHPGGYEIMLEYGGTDATNAFNEKPHTIEASLMLEKYLIGELIQVRVLLLLLCCDWRLRN